MITLLISGAALVLSAASLTLSVKATSRCVELERRMDGLTADAQRWRRYGRHAPA